jgi:hypothetical protein
MDVEDIIQLDTGFGKGLIGFILEKFLEKKFGVKFVDFRVSEFKIYTRGATTKYDFSIRITGSIDKGEILRLIQKGNNKEC